MSIKKFPEDNNSFVHFWGRHYKSTAKNITFVITHDCNLRCSYCYEHYKGCRPPMTLETAKKIIDLLFEEDSQNSILINDKEADALVLDFIGGEPFLEIDLISDIVDYFREKAFQLNHRWLNNYMINMTSNGVKYFDENVQKFLNNNLGRVSLTITLDGNKELHDMCRKFPDGSGSYDLAVLAAKDLYKKFGYIETKLTFAKENISYIYDACMNLINNLNIHYIYGNCAFEPNWNENDAKILYKELKKIADWLIDNKKYYDYYIHLLNSPAGDYQDPQLFNSNWCGGTGNMLAFDTNGEIYPCMRYTPIAIGDKQPKLLLGNLNDGLLKTEDTIKTLNMLKNITRTSQSEEKCLKCPIAEGCAWCSAYNYEVFGTPNKRVTNICIMHQARVLAHCYYINKVCNIENTPDKKIPFNIPEDWALNIIDKEEYDMIKEVSK